MLRNVITPRIFIAATRQDDGKTTTCIGLFAALQSRFENIGYIKPVGQRFVSIEGHQIDEDSLLIGRTYHVRSPLKAMSPIAVEPDFTRRYLTGGCLHELETRIQSAFDEAAWEKDFIIIEGTGHAGVGSVFDLSNARVAQLLGSKVIIVTQGGIGRPIDEIALNLPLFEKHHVEVLGVILNKVLDDKRDHLHYVEAGLARFGLPLLGAIPFHQELRKPTLNQIAQAIRGTFLSGEEYKRRRAGKIILSTMSSRHLAQKNTTGSLLITTADREEIIINALGAARENFQALTGIILTENIPPTPALLDYIRYCQVPCITTPSESFTVASTISRMVVKTETGDHEKIHLIQQLVENNIALDRILEAIGGCRRIKLPQSS
ncbi:MAG: AAA family ATPase [Methylacidiphilales bacterium]|nr:AAA family ATPase [Candidatus Methylacidiphilales bacterium]MDW8349750.1 AAA family ATPase [Verrucomicrobiae bacterium]